MIGLLCQASTQCVQESTEHSGLRVERIAEDGLNVRLDDGPRYRVAICNRTPLGGALGRQIEEAVEVAGSDRVALVRTGPFPDNPRTKLARRLGEIVAGGGRKVVVQDTDWRTIMAFLAFQERHLRVPGFEEWTRRDRPLSQLPSLRALFGLGVTAANEPERAAVSPPTPRLRRLPHRSLPRQCRPSPAPSSSVGGRRGIGRRSSLPRTSSATWRSSAVALPWQRRSRSSSRPSSKADRW